MLQKAGIDPSPESLSKRLAVMILYSKTLNTSALEALGDDGKHYWCLRCAVAKVLQNVAPKTPVDIYVFVHPKFLAEAPELPSFLTLPGVFTVPFNGEVGGS